MNGSSQRLVLIAVAIAIVVTLYEMGQSFRPAVCPECGHCRALAEQEVQTQEHLAREYARRVGLDDENDENDDRRID